MRLTPLDIINQQFKKSLKGYSKIEVDEFLEKIAKDYENLLQENQELKEKFSILEEKLKEYTMKENTLQSSLILAEKTAEERIKSAKGEAELIVKKAELQAEKIKEELGENLKKLKEELGELKKNKENFLIEYKTLLSIHQSLLEKMLK